MCFFCTRSIDELSIFPWVRNTCVAMGEFAEQIFDQSLQGEQASAGHSIRGHSQMTSVERGREAVGQFLTKGGEVAWIWY